VAERVAARREELMEHAAEVSRESLRSRRERILAGWRPILHTSLAAAAAWLIATELVGHERPFFAPIAAVITLGLTVGERGRRAIEIAIGVSVGVAIADVLILLIGTGTWQIAVVVALAMGAALLVGGGPLLASQAGVSAVLVATLQPPSEQFNFDRFFDALVGGGVALVISSLVFPGDPVAMVRSSAAPLLTRLASTLDDLAEALESRDAGAADRTLALIAELEPEHARLAEAIEAAGESARLAPLYRRTRGRVALYTTATREIGVALANVRALARGASRAIDVRDSTPPQVCLALRDLAESVRALGRWLREGDPPDPSREAAIRAAGRANAVLEQTANLSAVHLVGQIRLTAVDLLRATDVARPAAQEAVRAAVTVS
jgi:uncharacterized membrane protein YgaE (UPF0421/DUF939 family)